MLESEKPKFTEQLLWMFALYPNAHVGEAAVPSYWEYLRGFSLEAVSIALRRAPSTSPTFPPTAPTLHAIAAGEEKGVQSRRIPASHRVGDGTPRTMHGQAARILEASSPFEQLARYWEAEGASAPGRPVARDAGSARWAQFWKTWDRHQSWHAEQQRSKKEAAEKAAKEQST